MDEYRAKLIKNLNEAMKNTNAGGHYVPSNCPYMMTASGWDLFKESASNEDLKKATDWFNHDHDKSRRYDP